MSRCSKDPLRPLTEEERSVLEQISRSHSDPAIHVARSKGLLAVADGKSYTEAARTAGRRSGDAVSQLVSRFNRESVAAIEPRHGGGCSAGLRCGGTGAHLGGDTSQTRPGTRRHHQLVSQPFAACPTPRSRWTTQGKHIHDLGSTQGSRLELAGGPHLV